MDIESVVISIMKRAVDMDTKKRYTEALLCYQESLQVLDDKIRTENDENNKNYIKKKIEECMNRVDAIKELVKKQKEDGKYSEQVVIEEGSTGHGYKTLLSRFLDKEVEYVIIEDPYIRTFHQCQNFLILCELLVKSCDNLRRIRLKTSTDDKSKANQKNWFYNLQTDLQKYGIELTVIYSNSPGFKQIILSSGWFIKISRGLDFYKAPSNKFCLGVYDLDLRQCHETKINIAYSTNMKESLERSHIEANRQSVIGRTRFNRYPVLKPPSQWRRPDDQRGHQSKPSDLDSLLGLASGDDQS